MRSRGLKSDAAARRAMSRPSDVKKTARELEAAIQARCIEALEAAGCLVERRGEGQGRGKRGGAFKTGEPDLRVSYRGRTFGIEVKRSPTEELRPEQVAWYRANSLHVPYFVVCAHDQAMEALALVTAYVPFNVPYARDRRVEPHEAAVVLR